MPSANDFANPVISIIYHRTIAREKNPSASLTPTDGAASEIEQIPVKVFGGDVLQGLCEFRRVVNNDFRQTRAALGKVHFAPPTTHRC